jgi:hypothetical protein
MLIIGVKKPTNIFSKTNARSVRMIRRVEASIAYPHE